MKNLALLLILLFPVISLAQQPEKGTLKYLDFKRGFKDITLGADISTLASKIKQLQKNEDGTNIYDYKDPSDNKVGDVGVDGTLVVTYGGKIMRIMVFFDGGTGDKIDDIFRAAYGRYTDKPNQFMSKYQWDGVDVKLSLDYEDTAKPTAMFEDNLLLAKFQHNSQDKNKQAIDQL